MRIIRNSRLHTFEQLEQRQVLSGTPVLLADVNPGAANSNPAEFVEVDDTVFFAASKSGFDRGLWKTDGSLPGTQLVKGLIDGTGMFGPANLAAIGNRLFFAASDKIGGRLFHGDELWVSDGTTDGTMLVKNIRPGGGCHAPGLCPIVGSPPLGSKPRMISDVDGEALFYAFAERQSGLWKSDGTEDGTELLKVIDIQSGAESAVINESLFFVGANGVDGREIFKSDGTQKGTMLVKDNVPGNDRSFRPRDLSVADHSLYFLQSDSVRTALWKTGSTTDGHTKIPIVGENGQEWSVKDLVAAENRLYFIATPDFPPSAGRTARLWSIDVTTEEAVLLRTLPGNLFKALPFDFSRSQNPSSLTTVGNDLYFTAFDQSGSGLELWKSDGTIVGTGALLDIVAGPRSSDPRWLTKIGDTLYFTADDGIHGRELWRSDGTKEGTALVEDIKPGPDGSAPQELTAVDGTLFFVADDGVHGREPWVLSDEPESIPGDIDGNGKVAFSDFLILAEHFGSDVTPNTNGDIDGDGSVRFADFLLLSENFGRSTLVPAGAEASSSAPAQHEPKNDTVEASFAEEDSENGNGKRSQVNGEADKPFQVIDRAIGIR